MVIIGFTLNCSIQFMFITFSLKLDVLKKRLGWVKAVII